LKEELELKNSLLALPLHVFAHGGEQHQDQGTMDMTDHNAMDMSSMDHDSMDMGDSGAIEYGTGSESPMGDVEKLPSLGTEDDLLGLGTSPMQTNMESSAGMQGSMDPSGHDMGKKHIELAKHEMVSTSSKGYGLAVGVTVLSGLAFGFLMLVRPLE